MTMTMELLSLYSTKHRSKKYSHIASHPISFAAINAFVMSHEIRGNGSLVDFLVDMCGCLLISESHDSAGSSNNETTEPVSRQRSLRANQVPDGIRYHKRIHCASTVRETPKVQMGWLCQMNMV